MRGKRAAAARKVVVREAFPSARQARCAGLEKKFYPAYLQDQVDYDYLEKLSEGERRWLAAFTEEHVKGWGLKRETQVLSREARNASAATRMRLLYKRDPLVFAAEREAMELEEPPSADEVEDCMLDAIQRRRNGRR